MSSARSTARPWNPVEFGLPGAERLSFTSSSTCEAWASSSLYDAHHRPGLSPCRWSRGRAWCPRSMVWPALAASMCVSITQTPRRLHLRAKTLLQGLIEACEGVKPLSASPSSPPPLSQPSRHPRRREAHCFPATRASSSHTPQELRCGMAERDCVVYCRSHAPVINVRKLAVSLLQVLGRTFTEASAPDPPLSRRWLRWKVHGDKVRFLSPHIPRGGTQRRCRLPTLHGSPFAACADLESLTIIMSRWARQAYDPRALPVPEAIFIFVRIPLLACAHAPPFGSSFQRAPSGENAGPMKKASALRAKSSDRRHSALVPCYTHGAGGRSPWKYRPLCRLRCNAADTELDRSTSQASPRPAAGSVSSSPTSDVSTKKPGRLLEVDRHVAAVPPPRRSSSGSRPARPPAAKPTSCCYLRPRSAVTTPFRFTELQCRTRAERAPDFRRCGLRHASRLRLPCFSLGVRRTPSHRGRLLRVQHMTIGNRRDPPIPLFPGPPQASRLVPRSPRSSGRRRTPATCAAR